MAGCNSRALSIHHWFAYGTLGVSAAAVVARLLEARVAKLAAVKTGALLVAAALVSGAGFYGGKMAHGGGAEHAHPTPSGTTRLPSDHAIEPPHGHADEPAPAPTGSSSLAGDRHRVLEATTRQLRAQELDGACGLADEVRHRRDLEPAGVALPRGGDPLVDRARLERRLDA